MKKLLALVIMVALATLIGCTFNEYAQSAEIIDNIDDYRTGCQLDTERMQGEYQQYDANEFYYSGFGDTPNPTPTPSPLSESDIAQSVLLEKIWESACATGRADVVGAEQATLMGLKDELKILEGRIAALEPTPTPTPTPEPTTTPAG